VTGLLSQCLRYTGVYELLFGNQASGGQARYAYTEFMTLLGNFVEMSGQGENDPFIKNKRSERSMRGEDRHPHQEGNGSRTASHAVHVVHTPSRDAFFSLFSCPDKISQQSHEMVVDK
jgi:hypothetical protein